MLERGQGCSDRTVPGHDRGSHEEWSGHLRKAEDAGGGWVGPSAFATGPIDRRRGGMAPRRARPEMPRGGEDHRLERTSRGDGRLRQTLASVAPGQGGRGTPQCPKAWDHAASEQGPDVGVFDHHRGWSAARKGSKRNVDRPMTGDFIRHHSRVRDHNHQTPRSLGEMRLSKGPQKLLARADIKTQTRCHCVPAIETEPAPAADS